MKKWFTVLFFIPFIAVSQIPSKCLEIEKILVDACVSGGGCTSAASPACSCEGKNEMVLFQVGPNDINISDLYIDWPNNTYRGIQTPDATTAAITAALNSTIISCGWLVEPTGGVLPAGKKVLLITSTDFCTTANSFAGLSDTLYLIFQVAGNYQGHFVNYSSTPGIRELVMGVNSVTCYDTVQYDKSLLINQSGGYGGSTSSKDGAGVAYDWPGNPTYYNDGCTAPLPPPTSDTIYTGSFEGNVEDTLICPGSTITVTGTVSNAKKYYWESYDGIFGDTSALTTTYTDTSQTPHYIYLVAIETCNDTIKDSLFIDYHPNVSVTLNVSENITICDGSSTVLSATGADNYIWNTGETTSSITITTAGQYMVTGTNACYSDTDTVNVAIIPLTTLTASVSPSTTICQGNSAIISITSSNATSYLWSTMETTNSITVSNGGTYSVSATNGCNTVTQSFNISVVPAVNVSISTPSTSMCNGSSLILSATSGYSYLWNTGETTSSVTVTNAGTYMVTASNNCFSDIASVTITTITNITATLNTFPSSTICEGQQAAISVTTNSSSANYLWNTGETSSAVSVSVSGTYSVTVTDACGTVTVSESINVIPQITLTANASPSLYCPGDVITLTASGADNYLWQTGQTTASITVTSAGVFMVTGTNSCFSESLQISVTQGYVTDVSITSGDSILCSSSETIILQSVLSGNASIQWNTGETTSSISVSQPGTFYVMAVATCNTDTAFFNVYDKSVSVEVFANPASGMVPFETQLTQTSLNADAFSWMLNGNEVGTDTAYLYTMQEPGIDTVWLKASNMFGCTDSAMVTIVGETQSTVFIPNVFSPNKDGINEQFKIVFGNPSAVESVSVEIYNRWGVKIFDYQSVFGFWDGRTYSGEEAPDGTYLYVANYKLKDSEAVEVRGTVEKTGSSR